MAEKLSPWCKKAKIAMIQKDIGVSDMAERLGNNRSFRMNRQKPDPMQKHRKTIQNIIQHQKMS